MLAPDEAPTAEANAQDSMSGSSNGLGGPLTQSLLHSVAHGQRTRHRRSGYHADFAALSALPLVMPAI